MKLTYALLIFVLLSGACVEEPDIKFCATVLNPDMSEDRRHWLEISAGQWILAGAQLVDSCEEADMEIRYREAIIHDHPTLGGYSGGGIVTIRYGLDDLCFRRVVAHETGHVLFSKSKHGGHVMSSPGSCYDWLVTDEDVQWSKEPDWDEPPE